MIFAYIPLHQVEYRLRQAWMVIPPTLPHPVLDWYGALMVKPCECPESDSGQNTPTTNNGQPSQLVANKLW